MWKSDTAHGAPPLVELRPGPGAHVTAQGVSYSVWAPDRASMRVVIQRAGIQLTLELSRDEHGYWRGTDAGGRASDLYHYELPDGRLLPDMASRFQPQGVHGPSECIDPTTYLWRTEIWKRPRWRGQCIYEIHIGAFTPEGTYLAAIERLDHIRELGAEAVQLMPLADFPGDRNWGYDGVSLYAPARCYGRPDDLRALVDAAHARGLAVILDVVYNHLGPVGNYLAAYSPDYYTGNHHTPWGAGLNLDGVNSTAVRAFLLANAAYWLDEFRFDGLRLDATHSVVDSSALHLLAAITGVVHARGAFVIAEDERNSSHLVHPRADAGFEFDAVWADDLHHQIRVALTGQRDAHFASYSGTPDALADVLDHGWTFRGQPYPSWEGRVRGSPCVHLPASAFVVCIENHDQVGNRALGERLEHLVSPAHFRAASVLLCLSPYAPLLFMGQEWAASSPFYFFTDHEGEHGRSLAAARRREFDHWVIDNQQNFPDPQELVVFEKSKLMWSERDAGNHRHTLSLYQTALKIRRERFGVASPRRGIWTAGSIGGVVAVRYEFETAAWLLLFAAAPGCMPADPTQPLLEPPLGGAWALRLSSEELCFGGTGLIPSRPADFCGTSTALYEARKPAGGGRD